MSGQRQSASKAAETGIESMLRPAWIEHGEHAPLRTPCPQWCRWYETGHPVDLGNGMFPRHESMPLRVRQDGASRVFDVEHDDDPDLVTSPRQSGVAYTHLEVCLVRPQQVAEGRFAIELVERFETSRHQLGTRRIAPLYDYEVSELLAVLQHFASLGATS